MGILNYTTTIATEKTAMEIQKMLAAAGAQAVLCEYSGDGVMNAMSFRIHTPHGVVSFRLPAQLDGVYKALQESPKVPRSKCTHEQAARVAWRILKDWIEAQLAIIEAGMAEMAQVFLPYAQNDQGETVYETIANNGFKALSHQA